MTSQPQPDFLLAPQGDQGDHSLWTRVEWRVGVPYNAIASLFPELEDADGQYDEALADQIQLLQRMTSHTDARYLWIEQFCVDRFQREHCTGPTSKSKTAYIHAKKIIIWAGDDHEAEDETLDRYLGLGARQSTEQAFDFAVVLAQAGVDDVADVFRKRDEAANVASWAYLFRILCRPFFRRLPLLQTRYVHDLPSVTVHCSSSTIELSILHQATLRIFAVFPLPDFIPNLPLVPGAEDIEVLKADRQFALACLRFGFSGRAVWARIHWLFTDADVDGAKPDLRAIAHLGYAEQLYDIRANGDRFKYTVDQVKLLKRNPAEFIQNVLGQPSLPNIPSMPFELPHYPLPLAAEQAPFVHGDFRLGKTLQLLVLLPADTLLEPVSCGLVEADIRVTPDITFVTNSTFLRHALPPETIRGVDFPVTTKQNLSILINGQAFAIPCAQEVFLRLFRDVTYPKFLFMWNICMPPPTSTIKSREDVELYTVIKANIVRWDNCDEVDMYEVLENAGEGVPREYLEALGLPEGMEWEDWLVDLME